MKMQEMVRIESMSYGPDSVAHLSSGKCVFVEGGVPGDIANIEITKSTKSFDRARIVSLEEPSPFRVAPRRGTIASLSPWSNMDYAQQLASKQRNVFEAMRRIAKLDVHALDEVMLPIVGCDQEWGYRNKLELATFTDAGGRFSVGVHESSEQARCNARREKKARGSRKSGGAKEMECADQIVPVSKVSLANRLIDDAPKALQGALRYMHAQDLGIYRIGVRGSSRTKSVEVALWTPPSSFPRGFAAKTIEDAIGATSVVRVIADAGGARRVKRVERLGGKGFWTERMHCNGRTFKYSISAPSFFQVNTGQAEKLMDLALKGICGHYGEGEVSLDGLDVADLYSGAGTFTLPLAAAGASVLAIEQASSSVKDLVRNLDSNEVDAEVLCDDVSRALPSHAAFDGCIIDPPRSGLENSVIHTILEKCPKRLVYVSCDPQTLARDTKALVEGGMSVESMTPVDMFPQTYHVETVVVFC